MQNSNQQLTETVNTYQQPLMRYATYLVKNKLAAALIVEDVIDDYSKIVDELPKTAIRGYLKNNTLAKCKQWDSTRVTHVQ